jgi:hypothetical protein
MIVIRIPEKLDVGDLVQSGLGILVLIAVAVVVFCGSWWLISQVMR